MLFRTHFVFSLAIFLFFVDFFKNKFVFGLFFLFAILFVDLDSRRSRLGRLFIFRPIQWFVNHRGVFHSFFFIFFISLVLFLFNKDAGTGFFIGAFSHIFLDCFNVKGVKIFWPLFNFKIKGFIKSGSILEEILFVLFITIDFFLFVKVVLKILF